MSDGDDHARGPRRLARFSIERRRALGLLVLPAAHFIAPSRAWALAARVTSARLWPAQEYTRLIIESPVALPHQLIVLKDPDRIALDLEGIDLTPELQAIAVRVHANDPYIANIRFGKKAPDVVRLVIDLRTEVAPQLFVLAPIAGFGYRVVLDLYPATPIDPLMALLDGNRNSAAPPAESPVDKPVAKAIEKMDEPKAAARNDTRRNIIVAVDPGHGGEDPGAVGPRGTQEKDVVLAIAKKLRARIDSEPGMRAMLTRDDDYYVPLAVRVQKARRVAADLFISIHADAFSVPTARGSSVFALSEHGATSAAANWLARNENAADLIGGVNLGVRDPVLARTLLDLSQAAQISDSLKVGRKVLDGIGSINTLHKPAVEQAGFAVLKAPDIPSILVETAFISNPDEELKLRSDRQQSRFADSMHDGIRGYFSTNPPLARAKTSTGT